MMAATKGLVVVGLVGLCRGLRLVPRVDGVARRQEVVHWLAALATTWGTLPACAAPEWSCSLDPKEFKIEKRQESSVRIRPETMLVASDATKREVKLLKIPLGRGAATSFSPEDQIDLARYFASRQAAQAIGPSRIADIFRNSVERQVASPTSPLQGVVFDDSSVAVDTRKNRRYVSVDYLTDGCRLIDEDGACVGRSKRLATAVLTVSLESQARTITEQQRMDAGELEARYIDTLWLFTASAPAATKNGSPLPDVADTKRKLRDLTATFEVLD